MEFAAKLLRLSLREAASVAGVRSDDGPYTEAEIGSFERLRGFQNTFAWGRSAYAVAAQQDGLAVAAGDWGFFENDALMDRLEEPRIPIRLLRQKYLARLHCNEFGGPASLDLHSLSYARLLRCDLTSPPKNRGPRPLPRDFPDYVRDLEREALEFRRAPAAPAPAEKN